MIIIFSIFLGAATAQLSTDSSIMADFNMYGSYPFNRRSSMDSTASLYYDTFAQAQADAALNRAGISFNLQPESSVSRMASMNHIADQFPSAFLSSSSFHNEPWTSSAYNSRSNSLDFNEALTISDAEIEQLVSEIQNNTSSNLEERRNSLESVIRSLSTAWAGKASCNDPALVESRARALRRLSVTILNACTTTSTSAAGDVSLATAEATAKSAKRRMSSLSLMASLIDCPQDTDQYYHRIDSSAVDATRSNDNKRHKASLHQQNQQQRRSTLDLLASTLLANEATTTSNAGRSSNSNVEPSRYVSSLADFGMPRYSGNLSASNPINVMPDNFFFRPTVQMQALSFQSLSASMKATEESKRLIEEWDKQMGLKRSHSATVRNTARSRKMLQELMMSGQCG